MTFTKKKKMRCQTIHWSTGNVALHATNTTTTPACAGVRAGDGCSGTCPTLVGTVVYYYQTEGHYYTGPFQLECLLNWNDAIY